MPPELEPFIPYLIRQDGNRYQFRIPRSLDEQIRPLKALFKHDELLRNHNRLITFYAQSNS